MSISMRSSASASASASARAVASTRRGGLSKFASPSKAQRNWSVRCAAAPVDAGQCSTNDAHDGFDVTHRTGRCETSTRRHALVGLAAFGAWTVRDARAADDDSDAQIADTVRDNDVIDDTSLTPYIDTKFAFELKYPSSWVVASKPGAQALFKNPDAKYSNIGVTVSPVTINSLTSFGSVTEIGSKLAEAESKKESTIPGGVYVLSENERVGPKSGATFYDYEYRLITTHGNKRIYTSVTIVDSTLYILNAQVYESSNPENPTDEQKAFDEENAALYRRVGATFDASKRIFD